MKHLFIINPKAGKGKSLDLIPKIEEIFESLEEEPIIEITQKPGHATEIVQKYVQLDNYRIYSVGGDGTLNEILNGIINTQSQLGIIPAGSGNDFIKSLIIDKNITAENILEKTIFGESKKVDVGIVNNKYFINISSIGFDADVVKSSIKLKKSSFIPNKLAYLLSIFLAVFFHKNRNLEIILDNKKFNAKTTLLAICNGCFYGGGMHVAPFAKISDGYFDVCLVENISILKILMLFPKLIKGIHSEIKEVTFFNAKKVSVNCEEDININIDGELIQSQHIEFQILPSAINVIYPTNELTS
ncbi:diacylglycerol kinase family lipid kinase [Clostridium sediminicola]|uniref:diacylglycerol/lipid kinase family protein n=1 Tax=Clostridium sediminicola TaxID=3114879 RepID=UPI0031F1FE42